MKIGYVKSGLPKKYPDHCWRFNNTIKDGNKEHVAEKKAQLLRAEFFHPNLSVLKDRYLNVSRVHKQILN